VDTEDSAWSPAVARFHSAARRTVCASDGGSPTMNDTIASLERLRPSVVRVARRPWVRVATATARGADRLLGWRPTPEARALLYRDPPGGTPAPRSAPPTTARR